MIKNLPRQLNEAGKIKIGKKGNMITSTKGKEFRPPKKLDHFQLVTTEKDKNGDYIVDVDLQNKIKESGTGIQNENGCLVGLPIRLLYNDTELNFPHRYVSYVSGKLSCHGDGEISHKRVDSFKKDHSCPCDRVDQAYQGNDKCKPTGTLTCVIDEAGLFGQAHKFRTTSLNTIMGILGGIELIKTATNGKIAGLPLMLTMNAKQTVTPQGISTTVYIVSICYRGDMSDLRRETLKMLSTEKRYLLSMDAIETEAKKSAGEVEVLDAEEEKDFVEEFFPDAVVVESVENNGEDTVEDENLESEPENSEQKPVIETETENQTTNEDEEQSKNLLEPVGTYKKIYDQFIVESDFEKACAFAKRLQKGNLLYWLVNTYPDIDFESNIKKPEALELVSNVLKTVLNGSTPDPETTHETNQEESSTSIDDIEEETTDPAEVEYPREWDASGLIQKPQLRTLVELKTTLERQGILQPDKWVDHVSYFLDTDGEPIKKATNLSKKQGDTFIAMLSASVKSEEIAA